MAPPWRRLNRSWRASTLKPSNDTGVNAELMTAASPLLTKRRPYSRTTALKATIRNATISIRRANRRPIHSRCPLNQPNASRIRPAAVQRVPEKNAGGTAMAPAFNASQLVPQMTHISANSARCCV